MLGHSFKNCNIVELERCKNVYFLTGEKFSGRSSSQEMMRTPVVLAHAYFLPEKRCCFHFFCSVAGRLLGRELLFGPHWVILFYIIRSENYLTFTGNCVLPLLGNPVSPLSLGNNSPPKQVKTVSFFFPSWHLWTVLLKRHFFFS